MPPKTIDCESVVTLSHEVEIDNPMASVVDLDTARVARRVDVYRNRLKEVLAYNEQAVSSLCHTGQLFTKDGLKTGRDLLLAHQHLLRVMGLLERLEGQGLHLAPKRSEEVERIFDELDELLARTGISNEKTNPGVFRVRPHAP